MSKHYITAVSDSADDETEVRIHFTLRPYVPMRAPSYASGGEPEEPASIEFDSAQVFVLGKWVDAPQLDQWAEGYLQDDGLADAFETAHDDQIAAEEYAAEARAEMRADNARLDRATLKGPSTC